jgi:ferritin heavy chain
MVMLQVAAAGTVVTTPAAASLVGRSGAAGNFSTSRSLALRPGVRKGVVGVRASSNDVSTKTVTGVVFEPFNEVQDQLVKVTTSPQLESLARQRFSPSCEAAINDQIKYYFILSCCLVSFCLRSGVGIVKC